MTTFTGLGWRIDLAADSDPTLMTTVFQWMIDWAADSDSDPTSMSTVFQWMIDWAADSDRTWITTRTRVR